MNINEMLAKIPSKENQYQVIKIIGQGAFGIAYLAKDITDNKQYVIKLTQILDQELEKYAELECLLYKKFNHPNIVKFHDSFRDKDGIYIVIEYANGGTLEELIKWHARKQKYFDEDEIWFFFIQLVHAIGYVHSMKVIHRDIKGANIFIDDTQKQQIIKIGDFGMSFEGNQSQTVAMAQTIAGTITYNAPEQLAFKPYNNMVDMWSIGCILHEMCTLKTTFKGRTKYETQLNIQKGIYDRIPEKYSQQLGDIIGQLLELDPAKRISCHEILQMPFIQNKLKTLKKDYSLDFLNNINFNEQKIFEYQAKFPQLPPDIDFFIQQINSDYDQPMLPCNLLRIKLTEKFSKQKFKQLYLNVEELIKSGQISQEIAINLLHEDAAFFFVISQLILKEQHMNLQ